MYNNTFKKFQIKQDLLDVVCFFENVDNKKILDAHNYKYLKLHVRHF